MASYDQMKTQNHFMGALCKNVISWGGWNAPGANKCSSRSFPPVAPNEKVFQCTTVGGEYWGTVVFELDIATNLTPPPSALAPSPPTSPTTFAEEMGDKASERSSAACLRGWWQFSSASDPSVVYAVFARRCAKKMKRPLAAWPPSVQRHAQRMWK